MGGKEEEPEFTQGWLNANYHVRRFAYVISFHLCVRSMRQVILSFYRWGNWTLKHLGHTVSGAARIQPWDLPRDHAASYIRDHLWSMLLKW